MKTKKIISMLLVLCFALMLPACDKNSGNKESSSSLPEGTQKLSFKSASSYDYLQKLNGKQVAIDGYLATSSPADGSFIFLMNLPYQSCPFCVPNTSQLSNTLECYPKKGKKFDYSNQAVRVTGTLAVAEDKDKPFTDLYGYEFAFKIVDSEYTIIKSEELSKEMQLWQKLAQTDVITEVNNMYNYVNFLVAWPTYYIKSYTDENGQEQKGFYFYASDALKYLENEDSQYYYGTKEGYFDDIIKKINAVDENAFKDLTDNIKKAEDLANRAMAALKNGEYTYEYQYVDMFQQYDNVYKLNNGDAFADEMNELFGEYSAWLSNWEM